MPPAEISDAEAACVDFYRAVEESTVEERVYMRTFADRIDEAGHSEAAELLDDLAEQWAIGVWDGEQDEAWQSAIWAQAGALLAEAGELRCADLSEWWGIEAYEGRPDPEETLGRQAQIWSENQLGDYYLLVAGRTELVDRYTQIQVRVVNGEADEIKEIEATGIKPSDLPKTIDAYYDLIFELDAKAESFDLVHAYPRSASLSDGRHYLVQLDPHRYPDPLVYFDVPESPFDEGSDTDPPPSEDTSVGRLDCAPGVVVEERVPDSGQDPIDVASGGAPAVVEVEPGRPLWWWGVDESGEVIVALALGDSDGADYQVWTCANRSDP